MKAAQLLLVTIALAFTLVCISPASAAVIFGRDFQLNGAASATPSALQLTTAGVFKYRATAYLTAPLPLSASTSFEVAFSFQILGGTEGADGLALVIQDRSRGLGFVGAEGGNLSFYPVKGGDGRPLPSGKAFAVAVDDFRNADYGDADNNHISTLDNTTYLLRGQAAAPVDLNSGDVRYIWVDYSALAHTLSIYLSDTDSKPAIALLMDSIDLFTYLGDEAFFGFTAATGGLTNSHVIKSYESTSSVPEPQPCALLGAGLLIMWLILAGRRRFLTHPTWLTNQGNRVFLRFLDHGAKQTSRARIRFESAQGWLG